MQFILHKLLTYAIYFALLYLEIRKRNKKETRKTKYNMSEIVVDLASQGWSDYEICQHLGMEVDEVLRLKQVSGLKEAFADHNFSKSWIEFKEKLG